MTYPGNFASDLFQHLISTIAHDASSDRIEVIAANISAVIGERGRTYVGLVRRITSAHYGAADVLRDYGIETTRRERQQKDGWYIALEPAEPSAKEGRTIWAN